MNRWIGLIPTAVLTLAACMPDAPSLNTPGAAEQPTASAVPSATSDLSPYSGDQPPAAILIPGNNEQAAGVETATWSVEKLDEELKTYTDPAGQFSVRIPAEWQPGDVEGAFNGEDGIFRAGYLPEMAYMNRAYRVCERQANTPQGPVGQAIWYPLQDIDACILVPFSERSIELVRLVAANPGGEPEQRYFYLEADQYHFEAIAASLQLLNPAAKQEAFRYPAGPLCPEDAAFWGQTGLLSAELTVEEYAVAEAAIVDPLNFEFNRHIPAEVFQKRVAWRDGYWERRLAADNALLEPFGYCLKATDGSTLERYELYREDELFLDDLTTYWPVSVSASGSDFALIVEIFNSGYRLVRKDSLEDWDLGASQFIPPVL